MDTKRFVNELIILEFFVFKINNIKQIWRNESCSQLVYTGLVLDASVVT